GVPGGQVLRVPPQVRDGALPEDQHVPGDLLHHDRSAHVARHRRHGGERVAPGAGLEAVQDQSGVVHEPGREQRPVLAFRRPGLDLPVPGVVPALGDDVSDHSADIDKHVRIYILVFVTLMVLTLVTVSVSYLHLPIHLAIGVALLIATIKGSLVACYFMHLISEKKLIYTVLGLT